MTQHWTKEERARLKEIISRGLSFGLGNTEMTCIEGAISLARTGELGDQPPCVAAADRLFAIRLNDSGWSSPAARAEALMPIAFLQPGTKGTNRQQWVERVVLGTINRVLPLALDAVGLVKEAQACRKVKTLDAASEAARAALYAASEAARAADAALEAAYAADAASEAAHAAGAAADAARAAYAAARAAGAAAYASEAARAALYAASEAARAADAVLKEAAQVAVDAYAAEGRLFDEEFACETSTPA